MKCKYHVSIAYKQGIELGVFTVWTPTRKLLLMFFEVKKPENGSNNIYRDEQTTNRVSLMLLDAKVLTER